MARRELTGLLVRTDGTTETVKVSNSWDSIAKVLGCQWIEPVYRPIKPIVMYVNEEGWLRPETAIPNTFVRRWYPGPIAGAALFLRYRQLPDGDLEEESLTEEDIDFLSKFLSLQG